MYHRLCFLLVLFTWTSAQPCYDLNITDVKELAVEHSSITSSKGDDFGERCEVTEDIVVANPLNAIVNKERLWPDGISYYELSPEYDAQQVALIEAAIDDLVTSTMVDGEFCIQILQRTNETDYINVGKNGGCSSMIGMVRVVGPQPMSLVDSCVTRHGTIMHEFLHAYGFYHEQSRSDRDGWVVINWDNIEAGKKGNFIKMPDVLTDLLGTPYDYGSVMHYGPYGFTIDPNVPTIITCDSDAMNEIGQRTHLSSYDIERVQILYGCIDPVQSKHFSDLDFDWSSIL